LAGAADCVAQACEIEVVAAKRVEVLVHQGPRQGQRGVVDRVLLPYFDRRLKEALY
jgi:hypothetical protein